MNKQKNNSEVSSSYEAYRQRVGRETIPCYEPSVGKEELELITDVINRNWLSESKYTRQFETELAEICQRKYAVAFSNATAALICGMKSLGLREGDGIIVPSFAHSADPNSVSAAGFIPVFADVDEDTLCLSIKTIDAAKTPSTKAVLFVSAYGNVGELDKIVKYAKDNNLFLINDCAPALFGEYKGKPIASFGDFSVLSFFADKTITTGEGGMLLSDHLTLINEANIYKHDGRKERGVDLIERKGYNFRITELQSAVGVAQIKKAPYFIKRKKEILESYRRQLALLTQVKVFEFNSQGNIVPHRVVIFVKNAVELMEHLTSKGIGVRGMFMPMHSMPAYANASGNRYDYAKQKEFPITQKIFYTGVCLPSAPSLKEADIEFVCSSIAEYYK